MKVKTLFRPLYRVVIHNVRCISLVTAKILLRPQFLASRICLSYSAGEKVDGLGAQLQRILAINGLANYLSLHSITRPIEAIAIHPLDGLESPKDYDDFLKDVNFVIGSSDEDRSLERETTRVYVNELKLWDFCHAIAKIFLTRQKLELRITHPYRFVDVEPMMYLTQKNRDISTRLRKFASRDFSNTIVIHHRHGIGGMAIQPGQTRPREISLSNYSRPIEETRNLFPNASFLVVTDAPKTDLSFSPPSNQLKAWKSLPGFDGTSMKISGNSLVELNSIFGLPFEVWRGGNPLHTIASLSSSLCLILCNSSFGYVAAILGLTNHVFLPKTFWHPRLPHWHSF